MGYAHVVIDYQNIHLTGHGRFCPEGEPAHLCLVHPLHFATQVLAQRNLVRRLVADKAGETFERLELGAVHAFRGQPSNERDPVNYRRTQAQRSEWTRDRRVHVRYRTLKYYANGEVREKGIDVLVALELVKIAAGLSADDVVILAAHDTDQEPALELAHQLVGPRLETAGWHNNKQLRIPGARVWHTALDGDAFQRCADLRDYR